MTNIVKEVVAQNLQEAIDVIENLANTNGATAVMKAFAPKIKK